MAASASDAEATEKDAPPRASHIWPVLLDYIRPHRAALVLGGVLSLATAATGLALPLVVRDLIHDLDAGRTVAGALVLMTVLVIANAVIGSIGGYVLERTGESVVLAARRQLINRLLRLRLSAVEGTEPGDLMSRATADTTLVREVTSQSLVSGITGALTLLATVVFMGVVDAVLLAVTLFVLLSAALVVGVVVPRINRAAKRAQESVGEMGAALERVFGGFRMVKASGAESREERRVQEAAHDAWRAGVRAAKWQAVAGNAAGLAIQVAFVAVLTVGGVRTATGATDVGALVAFLLYIFYLMAPLTQLIGALTQFQVGAAAIARIQEALKLPTETGDDAARAHTVDRSPAMVTFEHVHFRYRPELPMVHVDVSFEVPVGGMTAFVGPSGAGKTTLFSLLERFYEPCSGRVLVDGTDVRHWPLPALRGSIGYVEQDAPVLSGTLRENLLFAAPDASDADLQDVVRTARLDDLLARLPDRLDTQVGHRGMKLSGGERQRVAIARALLRRPRLLLLDEATSQLDAVNEAALRDTIAAAARTTTVLVVAHRLSTVTMADRIVVMDGGRVQAVGTHAELVAGNALYAELAATQFLASAS